MLPPGLSDLITRLEAAIEKHGAGALRTEILAVAEPQIALFPIEDLMTISSGEIHERARKVDPSIPEGFRAAMKSPGLDALLDLLRAQRAGGSGERPGATRVGGVPDLPPDLAWPAHAGKFLPFIAQIELAALPRWPGNPLPQSGWLWVFAGGDDFAGAILYWDGAAAALRRHPTPPPDGMHVDFFDKPEYDPTPLEQAEVVVNVPGYGSEWWNANVGHDDEQFSDAMMELVESLDQLPNHPDKRGYVWLLGQRNFDEASATEMAVTYGGKTGSDWVPLLQVGSVGSMCWSDVGTLAFVIRAADLAKADFRETYVAILSS